MKIILLMISKQTNLTDHFRLKALKILKNQTYGIVMTMIES